MNALTDEDMDQSIGKTNTSSSDMRRNVSYNAIITPGEASESDEDDYEEQQHHQRVSSIDHTFGRSRYTSEMSQSGVSQRSTISDDNSLIGDSNKYNSLLHRKLREKNYELKKGLAEVCCGPYNMATKEISNITKQLIQSQKLVQNVSSSLRKVSKELHCLDETIDSIKNDKNLLFNEFIQ